MLRKNGYSKHEIDTMKFIELEKIQFAMYKQNYIDWYGIKKFAPEDGDGSGFSEDEY